MNTSTGTRTALPEYLRFIPGLLAVVLVFVLYSPLATQAHGEIGHVDLPAASERLHLLDMVSLSERTTVPDKASELVETVNWKQLDAALSRPGADCSGISEAHNGGSPVSARNARQLSEAQQQPAQAALPVASSVPPRNVLCSVALPIGTPVCFLPAERGLVAYPTPPPHSC